MEDKELFQALAREGEVWHEPGEILVCGGMFKRSPLRQYELKNPDFSTPDGEAWLRERLPDKGISCRIFFYETGEVYVFFGDRNHSVAHQSIGRNDSGLSKRFCEALKLFLKEIK